jgi:hypothetical protein
MAIATPNIVADTLNIVFPNKMVTNNLLGVSSKVNIYLLRIEFCAFNKLSCFLSSENNATSEPEKKADITKENSNIITLEYKSISN